MSHLSRREFLAASLGAAALPYRGFAAEKAIAPLVGSQLYGWGQYYQREGKNLGDHMDEVLSALRDAGYDYAEGTMDSGNPENNIRFAEKLKARGLKPVALYTGGRLHEQPAAEKTSKALLVAAKVCREQGFSVINCNADPIGREKTDEELKTQIESLKTLGSELSKVGMKLGIHHHLPEMANDAREFHYNFRNSDPKVVGFCYDVHWVFKGGVKPEEALKQYGDRVVSWHLRQSRNGIWWEDLDTGEVDYSFIADYAQKNNLPGVYSVELALENGTKITRSVVENHARSREFVKRVFKV